MTYKIYGTSVCPHCKSALQLLLSKGLKTAYFDVGNVGSPTKQEFEELAGKAVRSVPIIIAGDNSHQEITRGDTFIGTFADLQKHLETANVES